MHWNWPSKFLLLTLGIFFSLVLAGWILFTVSQEKETKFIFLSVGEGDAILITRGSNQILIDSGREGGRLMEHLGKYLPFYDRTIEVALSTHPDADHIGGFTPLLKRYRVGQFFFSGATSDTETYTLLERALQETQTKRVEAFAGVEVSFGQGSGDLRILFPATPLPREAEETNTGSIVSRFSFGETSFLLTGDLPEEELYLPEVERATVLKVAHHGSRYSTSDAWLDLVQPEEVVISVGPNSYGHPDQGVVDRLTQHGARVFRTDEEGDIVYRCRNEWQSCRRD